MQDSRRLDSQQLLRPKRLVNLCFKDAIQSKILDSISQKHRKLISNKQWRFNFDEYSYQNINKIFGVTKKILISSLSLHYCKNVQIIKEIQHIEFSQLKTLYLTGNSIKSLQPLSNINMLNLERLYLRKNKIVSLKPFRKCCFKLKVLDLSQNQIKFLIDLWNYLDLSQLQEFLVYENKNLILTFNFVKGLQNYTKINLFWISCDTLIKGQDKIQFLKNLGVKNVRIYPQAIN